MKTMCSTLYAYLRVSFEQPPVHGEPLLAEHGIISRHVQGREAGVLHHCGCCVLVTDAGLCPLMGKPGSGLQKMPHKPELMVIIRRFGEGLILPVEDDPGLWQEHLVLSTRAGAHIHNNLQYPSYILHHLGSDITAGEVLHALPLDGDLCRQQDLTYNI